MPLPPIEASDLMLATVFKRPFSDDAWLFDLKYDGYRCLVRKSGPRTELVSREGNLLNASFPEVVAAVAALPGDFAMDAELTVDEDTGRSSFERLQRRAVTKTPRNVRAAALQNPARLYLFDALALDGKDLRALPLVERRQYLRGAFENTNTLILASGIVGAGEFVFEQVKAHDLEGMIAKRLSSPYVRGRTRDWLKIKYQDYSRQAALGFGRKKKSPT
jgi:bifunctional non-homologous end joining protein LigD